MSIRTIAWKQQLRNFPRNQNQMTKQLTQACRQPIHSSIDKCHRNLIKRIAFYFNSSRHTQIGARRSASKPQLQLVSHQRNPRTKSSQSWSHYSFGQTQAPKPRKFYDPSNGEEGKNSGSEETWTSEFIMEGFHKYKVRPKGRESDKHINPLEQPTSLNSLVSDSLVNGISILECST